MQSYNDLQSQLKTIDHKSYPLYKSLRGSYQFPKYILSIDHVQELRSEEHTSELQSHHDLVCRLLLEKKNHLLLLLSFPLFLLFSFPLHSSSLFSFLFFFNDTATTEIYTLSLHDALPILISALLPMIGDVAGMIGDAFVTILPAVQQILSAVSPLISKLISVVSDVIPVILEVASAIVSAVKIGRAHV